MTTLRVSDSLKMLRETFCVAQTLIGNSPAHEYRADEHIARLQRLIENIDYHRPLDSDGVHRQHTLICGCEDK